MRSVETIEALAARRNRADDDALADRVVLLETGTQLLDDADRFVAENEAGPYRILAADNVHVGAADRCRRDSHDGFAGTRGRPWDLLDGNAILPLEYNSLHRGHDDAPEQKATQLGYPDAPALISRKARPAAGFPSHVRIIRRRDAGFSTGVTEPCS